MALEAIVERDEENQFPFPGEIKTRAVPYRWIYCSTVKLLVIVSLGQGERIG